MAYTTDEYLGMFNTIIKTNYLNKYFPWKSDPKVDISDELYNTIVSWDGLTPEEKKNNIRIMLRESEVFSCFRISLCVYYGDGLFDPTQENYEDCDYDGYEECQKQSNFLVKLISFINSTVSVSILSRININSFYDKRNSRINNKLKNLRNKT